MTHTYNSTRGISKYGDGYVALRRSTARRRRALAACVIALLTWQSAIALADNGPGNAPGDLPMFSFDGFGTLGVVHSSEDNAEFTGSLLTPTGAGFGHSWSAAVDSLIAAQMTANVTSKLSAVLQIVSEQNYDDTYTPHMEWANVKYQFTPDFDVRIGRTALPVFMLTDTRLVRYAIPWVRLPVELYELVPVTSNDGVDASYGMSMGAGTNTVHFTAGGSDSRLPLGDTIGTIHARGLRTISDTFEEDFATLRVTYGRSHVTIAEFDSLFDGFRQFGPQGVAIADQYDFDNRVVKFFGMGASYDPGKWFVMSELGHFSTDSVLGDNLGWYVSGGPRLGRFTLFATYAARKVESNRSDPGLTVTGLPPAQAIAAAQLNAILNEELGAIAVQRTISAGVRWDFMKDLDFKLQFDHTRNGAGSPGILQDLQPGFKSGGTVNLISASLDCVF
jgi:hypothetical protein